jgi:hypothetical protein
MIIPESKNIRIDLLAIETQGLSLNKTQHLSTGLEMTFIVSARWHIATQNGE